MRYCCFAISCLINESFTREVLPAPDGAEIAKEFEVCLLVFFLFNILYLLPHLLNDAFKSTELLGKSACDFEEIVLASRLSSCIKSSFLPTGSLKSIFLATSFVCASSLSISS